MSGSSQCQKENLTLLLVRESSARRREGGFRFNIVALKIIIIIIGDDQLQSKSVESSARRWEGGFRFNDEDDHRQWFDELAMTMVTIRIKSRWLTTTGRTGC